MFETVDHKANLKKNEIGASDYQGYTEYLDNLRDSGITNMFGAVPYLRSEYSELNRSQAEAVLSAWMADYKDEADQKSEDKVSVAWSHDVCEGLAYDLPEVEKAGVNAADGTFYQGMLDILYDNLVKYFGEPHTDGDGHKVDAEWVLDIDGTVVTIYNYKDGINYLGVPDGLPVNRIKEWHIGGKSKRVCGKLTEIISKIC